ncbi:Retrovirus-related Pol polyprotein from transposon 17.6 [Dictyocoela muelleri]|nr:Retrovirus-related Pol polyprotein from transposon 17.6 [Dictyocoela muelleri]
MIYLIKKNTLLVNPDLNKEFVLECDASNYSISSVLKKKCKAAGFFSKYLSKSEINYSVTEKEMVSTFKSLNNFKRLLFGSKIIVYTDHAKLIHENNISNRINKCKIALMDFNFTLKYIKGSKNIIDDKLSRLNKLSYSSSIANEIEKIQKGIKMKENYKKLY